MIVNETKTKIMTYNKPVDFHFMYSNKVMENVCNYRYLGVVFKATRKCNSDIFCYTCNQIRTQARKATFKILKNTK